MEYHWIFNSFCLISKIWIDIIPKLRDDPRGLVEYDQNQSAAAGIFLCSKQLVVDSLGDYTNN